MSPDGQLRVEKPAPMSNLYTVLLMIAFGVVLATAAFVAYMCYSQYHTFFKIP
jgi:hypothetical protein